MMLSVTKPSMFGSLVGQIRNGMGVRSCLKVKLCAVLQRI